MYGKSHLQFGSGFYFTENSGSASFYGNVFSFYLNICNPYNISTNGYKEYQDEFILNFKQHLVDDFDLLEYKNNLDNLVGDDIQNVLVNNGYDGIVYGPEYVVAFEPNQIKSITNKKPTTHDNVNESLTEALVKLLEGFRDYDRVIDDVSSQMDDILDKYRYWGEGSANLSEMELDNDDMETQDVIKFYNLQKKLISLENQREEEYNNEVSNLPPETTKTNFEGFDITKTDPSYDEYFIKGNKNRDYVLNEGGYTDAYIVEMTPEEYLKLCGKYGWQHIYDNIDEIIEYTPDKYLIDEYVEMFKQGKKAPMPVLDINHRSQEGRHRALACIKAGIKTMPVLIKV